MDISDVVESFQAESEALARLWEAAPDDLPIHYLRLGMDSLNHLHNALETVVRYLAERDDFDPDQMASVHPFRGLHV